MHVYVESGAKRVFAGALAWPGWCRSARTEDAAVEALLAYAPRYAAIVKTFSAPRPGSIEIVERLKGDAGTDFGAPSAIPRYDEAAPDVRELKRLTALLEACWTAFDATANKHAGAALAKGPRGGGRELDKIVEHVREADAAYLAMLGGKAESRSMMDIRAAIVHAAGARARGEPPLKPRRSGTYWPSRYGIRRSAWHALDHAWEIEDRAR